MRVFDNDDFITLVQDSANVEAYDASVDNITTTGVDTNVLDLGDTSPNYLGQSLYITPRTDGNGAGISGVGDPKIIAELYDGETDVPTTLRATAKQADADEELEIPLPKDVRRYIKVKIKSDGGGDSNAIASGAVAVRIGQSGLKE